MKVAWKVIFFGAFKGANILIFLINGLVVIISAVKFFHFFSKKNKYLGWKILNLAEMGRMMHLLCRYFYWSEVGFPIGVSLCGIGHNCSQIARNCAELHGIADNCTELHWIVRNWAELRRVYKASLKFNK